MLRTVKLFRYFKDLWLLVNGLTRAFRTIVWVMLLLLVVIYVCALFLTNLIKHNERYINVEHLPIAERMARESIHDKFSSVPRSMHSLFAVMTLEGWDVVGAACRNQ